MQVRGDTELQRVVYIYNNTNGTNDDYKVRFLLTYYYDSTRAIRSHYVSDLPKNISINVRNNILNLIKK